jgi:uncharacterized SAM-binding protein YcdF (DUF218 family)
MFLLKQFIKPLLLPPGIWLVLMLVVLVFWKRKWARKLLFFVALAAFLLHSNVVSTGLFWGLESRHPALLDPRSAGAYDAIVTLTAGAHAPSGLVPFPYLEESQFRRLEEAFRLYRIDPKPIIVSGGHADPFTPSEGENRIICDYLLRWGVPAEHVIGEPNSRDTFESALEVRKILQQKGWRRYLLVTSAIHMPRSMFVFSRIAPEPVAAPGDFTVEGLVPSPLRLLPSEGAAKDIAGAFNEYYGLLNYRLRLLYDAP